MSLTKEIKITILILLSIVFGFSHVINSYHLLNYQDFIDFKITTPFQARFLTIIPLKFLSLLGISLSLASIKLYFVILDSLSFGLIVYFISKVLAVKKLKVEWGCALTVYLLYSTYVFHTFYLFYYPYDILSILLISIALYLIESRKSLLNVFVVIFIGCLNRETILLVIFYWFYKEMPIKDLSIKNISKVVLSSAFLMLAWILAKAIIYHFLHKAGYTSISGAPGIYYHTEGVLRIFNNYDFSNFSAGDQRHFLCGFGYIMALIPIVALINRVDSLLMVMLTHFTIYSFVGNLFEIRVYGDLFPFFIVYMMLFMEKLPTTLRVNEKVNI